MLDQFHELPLASVLTSWEDGDCNRHFPLGNGRFLVCDGCTGHWRGIVELSAEDVSSLQGGQT